MKAKENALDHQRSQIAVAQITEEATADIAKKILASQPQRTIEEDVTDRAEKVVEECCKSFLRMRDIKVTPTTFGEAVRMLYDLNRVEFGKFTKDELVILTAFQNAIISVESLRNELI